MKTQSREHLAKIKVLEERKGFDLSNIKYKGDKKLLLRNCVESELGLHIFNEAFKGKQNKLY